MPAKAEQRSWRVAGGVTLAIRFWHDDCLVYNPLSGHTHILDFISGRILQVLSGAGLTDSDMHRLVATELDLPVDPDLTAQVDHILSRLEANALIASHTPC